MSDVTFELIHGMQIDGKTEKTVIMRELRAGDVIEANEDAEKLVKDEDDVYQFVLSPTLVGIHSLRRQIKRVGKESGPFNLDQMKMLHPDDLDLMLSESAKLEQAAFAEQVKKGLAQRGESESPSTKS